MNKYIPTSLLAVFLLVGCGEGEDRQARYMERAQEYFAEANYDKAKIDAKNVLQINPKNAEARLLLGEINFAEGDIRKAYGMFQSVIEDDEANWSAQSGLARLYTAVKAYEQALTHADKALEGRPDDIEVMGYKSVALAGLGRSDEAELLAGETLARDAGNSAALGVMSQVMVNQGTPEKALELLQKGQQVYPDDDRISIMKIAVLEQMNDRAGIEGELKKLVSRHPDSANYSNMLVRYYVGESRFDDAESEMRRYTALDEDSIEAGRRLIEFLQQHKSHEAAIAQAKAFIESEPDKSAHYVSMARLHLFTGDNDLGMASLEQAINTDPRSVGAIEARNMIAHLKISNGDLDSAGILLEEILEIEPENEAALLRRAGLSMAENQLNEGIADLRVVLKNNPENALALSGLARAQEANGSDQLALDNYKKLMTLKKPDVDTLASAARLAIKGEQYPEAERYVRQALELEGDNAALVTNLIRLLVLKEDWQEAESFANRLVEAEASQALGYYLKAGLNLQLDEKNQAIDNLKKSLQVKPEAVESLTALAKVLSEEQGVGKAIEYVGKHCDAYGQQAHCRYILGSLHAQKSEFDLAENELKTALKIDDQLVATYLQLAKVYAAQGKLDQLENALATGIETTNSNKLRFEVAGFNYARQNFEKAAAAYESILQVDSEALVAHNNLAMIYAENIATPETLKRARSMVTKLQETEIPAYLDTVGWVMYLNGEYDQAISYIKAAVDKVGSSALLQYHLGMAYFKAGDNEKAKQHLILATQEKTEYHGYKEAMETLQSL